MAKFEAREKDFVLKLSEKELDELGISTDSEFEIIKGKKGLYILLEKELTETEKQGRLDKKIFSLIKEKPLKERVEGKFESLLNKEELKRFRQLLKEKKVIPFKLSKKYSKAVYKLPEAKKKESECKGAKEKPIEEYSLEKDGFIVVKNEERAKKLSRDLEQQVKEGTIKGIRSFDGFFYIIESPLYEKYREVILKLIEASETIPLEQITESVNISPILSKIVCELLKDEGEIIEKRKNLFEFVK